jgi:hypothetical protein
VSMTEEDASEPSMGGLEECAMGYAESLAFWSKNGVAPLDIGIFLALGKGPDEFDDDDSRAFACLKSLAMSHAISGKVKFKAANNSATWQDDPIVFLPEFTDWAQSCLNHRMQNEMLTLDGRADMPLQKPLGPGEQYEIDEIGRLLPVH